MAGGSLMRPYVPLSVDFFGDDKVIELTPLARLEYAACLVIAKRQESDGRVTTAQVRREQPDVPDHEGLLEELVEHGLLSCDGANAYVIVAWLGWNKSADELAGLRQARAVAGKTGGKRSGEARSSRQSKHFASTDRSTLLQHVEASVEPNTRQDKTTQLIPTDRKSPSDSAPAAPARERQRDLLFEAIVSACGWELRDLTRSGRGQANGALKELRAVGADPAEVERRAAEYRARYAGMALTPTALVKHWAALLPPGHPSGTSRRTISANEAERLRRQERREAEQAAAAGSLFGVAANA